MIRKTLGHYLIPEGLGEGGMRTVHKARDTHIDRFVAIKILPPGKVADPDRKRCFVLEDKAAWARNHPGICIIFGIDTHEGRHFIGDGVSRRQDAQTSDRGQASCRGYVLQIGTLIAKGLEAAGAGSVCPGSEAQQWNDPSRRKSPLKTHEGNDRNFVRNSGKPALETRA